MIRLQIRKSMEVVGSCGKKLGSVDRVEGRLIKLTNADSADGNEHYIPLAWIDRIDERIHLNRKCSEVIPQQNHFAPAVPVVVPIVADPEGAEIHDAAEQAISVVTTNNDVRPPDDGAV